MEVDITRKAKNIIRFGLLGLVILALAAGGSVYFYQHQHKSLTVYDAKVTGTMIPAKAATEGTITEILVQDGDHVEAGDVIARIEPSITDEQILQLQQNLDLSRKNLEQIKKGTTATVPAAAPAPSIDTGAQQRAQQAYSRLQRMNELFSMGAISAAKRDEAAAEYASAQAAASQPSYSPPAQTATTIVPANPELVQQAEAQVKQAEAALANAQSDQKATEILAPAAGTVILADEMTADSPVKADQVIAELLDAENMWLEAAVSPEQAKKIRLGQFASYDLDGHSLQGSVKDILEPAEPAESTEPQEKDSGDASPADNKAEDTDDAADDSCTILKVSIPSGLSFAVKPGMTATLSFSVGG